MWTKERSVMRLAPRKPSAGQPEANHPILSERRRKSKFKLLTANILTFSSPVKIRGESQKVEKFARPARDFGGVSGEQRADDGDRIGSGFEHGARVLARDAADGDERQTTDGLAGAGDAFDSDRGVWVIL